MRKRKQPLRIVARNVIAIGNPNSSKKKCGPTNLFYKLKGVRLILSDYQYKDGYAQFTTVPLKPLSVENIVVFRWFNPIQARGPPL